VKCIEIKTGIAESNRYLRCHEEPSSKFSNNVYSDIEITVNKILFNTLCVSMQMCLCLQTFY
jgi:hypothetical protein